MANLTSITEAIGEAGASLNEFISDNKSTLGVLGVGLGGVALGTLGGIGISGLVSKSKRTSKSRNRRKRSSRGRARDRKFISKQKWERAYAKKHPKRRRTGRYYKTKKGSRRKGVKYTKNGQPYIILKSGKARFVKKK